MSKNDDKYAGLRLDNQLCFPLYCVSKEITRQYRKPLKKLNLTYTQYVVMMVLWEHGSMTEGELGQIELKTLKRLLDKAMTKMEFVK